MVVLCVFIVLFFFLASPLYCREHKIKAPYGQGLTMTVVAPEGDVVVAVDEVINSGIIHGSIEYNKDKYIEKASAASSCDLPFPRWTGGGRVFYKVRNKVLAPVNFKGSADEGTLGVRYIVESKNPQQTLLRIDAVFVEDFRRVAHQSNGSVEGAEYKDIQEQVQVIELQKKLAAEAEKRHAEERATLEVKRKQQQQELLTARAPEESLEQHVEKLRREVERVVKSPGTQLRSAPFKSASSLQALPPGAHVAILISTPYWYGVETEDGRHGWIQGSQLEQLP
jgi:hypothetical protein